MMTELSDDDLDALIERYLEGHRFTVGADLDREVLRKLEELARDLPHSYWRMIMELGRRRSLAVYEVAVAFASGLVRDRIDVMLRDVPESIFDDDDVRLAPDIYARIARRYAKDERLRGKANRLAQRMGVDEVALPLAVGERWDQTGWRRGIVSKGLHRHATGRSVQQDTGVPVLETIADVRELLGITSPEQLGFFLLASDQSTLKPYHTFTIPKRRGGQRQIAAPGDQLRVVQQKILHEILAKVPAHEAAHGFIAGRSTLTNATPHVGKALVVKFDLQDFFDTVNYWRVVGLYASFGYPVGTLYFSKTDEDVEVAPTLARLCCYTDRAEQTRGTYTPQGAPTSPAISNLVCRTLDKRLHHLAESLEGHYTRYADDLTFSFARTPSKGIGRFRWWVNQICQQEGFLVREDKFRVIRDSQQQRVTGIVVNEKPALPRKERRRFRAIVHNCEQHGLASQARVRQDFEAYLMGYASYMNMVHPEEGADMLRRVKALVAKGGDNG